MKPSQSSLSGKMLVRIWLLVFVLETLYVRLFPGPRGPHYWTTSFLSGIVLATLISGSLLLRAVFGSRNSR